MAKLAHTHIRISSCEASSTKRKRCKWPYVFEVCVMPAVRNPILHLLPDLHPCKVVWWLDFFICFCHRSPLTWAVIGRGPNRRDGWSPRGRIRSLSVSFYCRGWAHEVVLGITILQTMQISHWGSWGILLPTLHINTGTALRYFVSQFSHLFGRSD